MFLGKLVANLKLYEIYLKTSTWYIWSMLNLDILWYFTQNLNFDKLILNLKSHRIYLKFCSRVNIWNSLQWIWHHYFDIIHLKYKLGQIGPKIKALKLKNYTNICTLDNLKIANANMIIKGFSNSNPTLRKCSSNILLQGDQYQNFLSS